MFTRRVENHVEQLGRGGADSLSQCGEMPTDLARAVRVKPQTRSAGEDALEGLGDEFHRAVFRRKRPVSQPPGETLPLARA